MRRKRFVNEADIIKEIDRVTAERDEIDPAISDRHLRRQATCERRLLRLRETLGRIRTPALPGVEIDGSELMVE